MVEDWDGVGFEGMRIGMGRIGMGSISIWVEWEG